MKRFLVTLFVLLVSLTLVACGQDSGKNSADGDSDTNGGDDKIKIGLSVSDLQLERWQHDRDIFTAKAEELGAEVIVQSANGDSAKQLSQVENLLSQDIDAL